MVEFQTNSFMNGKKTIEKSRRIRRHNKTLVETAPAKSHPTDYFVDGYYGAYQSTRTVVAVGLATALVLE